MTPTLFSRLRNRLCADTGSLLIELLIAMMFLAVAAGALISVYASSTVSLVHTSIEGNALTLAETRMEAFKAGSYSALALDASTIPSASDVYVTDPPSNLSATQRSTIVSGQRTGGTQSATQLVTGPDNRRYRVDTYVFSVTPPSGQSTTQVSIAVRLVSGSTAGAIRARLVSTMDVGTTQQAS